MEWLWIVLAGAVVGGLLLFGWVQWRMRDL